MPDYGELAAPPRVADSVQCFWTMRHSSAAPYVHRVVPDSCADILLTRGAGNPTLTVVGAMTKYVDFTLTRGQFCFGVRFRPGMWAAHFGLPGDTITDMVLPLEDLWGARARGLLARMIEAKSPSDCAAVLAANLRLPERLTPVQQAIAWMERSHGLVLLDEAARYCGLSSRQFRRLVLKETGLSPKFLARVLRFRHALSLVSEQAGEHAGLAADCDYTDQSHFIAEFRQFTGKTPAAYLRPAA